MNRSPTNDKPRRRLAGAFASLAIAGGLLLAAAPAFAAAPAANTGSGITVDGDLSEWSSADFFANMYRAAKSDKEVESELWLRYDCSTNILYVAVKAAAGVTIIASDDDNYVKFGQNDKRVDGNDAPPDGTQPNFAYAGETGWEASFSVAPGTYPDLNVHAQVQHDGSQTSAVEDRAIELQLVCGQSNPTPTPTATPTGTPNATPTATPTPDQGGDDASLKIRKISTERTATGRVIRLEGAVFTVEGQPGTFTTDERGEFCITGLPEDVVLTVTEITPPAGYELANPASQEVEVDDGGDCDSAEAVFENAPEAAATPTPTPEGSQAGSTGTPKPSKTPEGSVAAATGTPRGGNLPNTAIGSPVTNPIVPLAFAMILVGSIGTLAVVNVDARRRR